MAKKKNEENAADGDILDYRHKSVSRLNIPPAGLAARGKIAREGHLRFAYNPHLPPVLRFDAEGKPDRVRDLLIQAGKRKLEPDELKLLLEAFRNHEPWLEWSGKREQQWCVADPVALHIHERISTQAILRVVRREDVQRDLFADPEQEYREAVQFYKHSMDWTNRMILGDSLAVMASLSRREALAGKVQMIYMDPPYGIKYSSNFQPEVGRRDVKDRDDDLTREPEMVKAYRDTWTLGVHSYLSYLRDRLLLCRELLADSGSIFVQIGEENLHLVRSVVDEVFGRSNACGVIVFNKTGLQSSKLLPSVCDYILWYSRDKDRIKYKQLTLPKIPGEEGATGYNLVYSPDTGFWRSMTKAERDGTVSIPRNLLVFDSTPLLSDGASQEGSKPFEWIGSSWELAPKSHWKTNQEGLTRLQRGGRLVQIGNRIEYRMMLADFGQTPRSNIWLGLGERGFTGEKLYTVQTAAEAISRCLLMATDPGDLVLDPTCGSGTTAYIAEQWGRRWITIDVSRVALAIARQRVLTAKFDYYKLRPTSAEDVERNPVGPWLSDPTGRMQGSCTFECKTVPHVTLKSIAQNQALDSIFEKWEPILGGKLDALNKALEKGASREIREKLLAKLSDKRKKEGKKAVTDADERRWVLPPDNRARRKYTTVSSNLNGWYEWEVPFDSDPDWPESMREALAEYRKAWRGKMDDVNACIAARADQEELVDQPFTQKETLRVSGPFTMEGIIPAEESIEDEEPEESPIQGAPGQLETFEGDGASIRSEAQNTEAYVDRMIRLLRADGVMFPHNKAVKFSSLEALADGSTLHAKGTWGEGGEERRVAVMFGPQYGPLIVPMVEEGIRMAARRGFDELVFAAFGFDGAAQAVISEDPDPKLRIHMAQIRPDVNMGDLLKTTVASQLFTVSGSPRTSLKKLKDGQFIVKMEGVDLYDPVSNSVRSTGAEKVAAWFLDIDYDGRCFCVCQAFFPDASAWEKIGRALGGALDESALEKLSGTTSLPFSAGRQKRIAVKVIDPRGNEVMRIHRLDDDDE